MGGPFPAVARPVQGHPWLLSSSQTHPQDGQTDPPLDSTTLKILQVLFTGTRCPGPLFVLLSCRPIFPNFLCNYLILT